MKAAGRIYARDIRNIVTNWAAAIIVSGLVALPSLYAWFNIEASWDPYGQTGGITVAVVNDDKGAAIRGTPLNIGAEVVDSLKENHDIGWIFVNDEQALQGVRHGDYYASITIPADFSEKIATVVTPNPQKAELVYTVNEKINAIAPKITAKGASSIVDKISSAFVKTANGAIFRVFNEIGVELQRNLPDIEKVRDAIFRLEAMMPEIHQAVDVAVADVNKASAIAQQIQQNLPLAAQLAQEGADFSSRLGDFLGSASAAMNELRRTSSRTLRCCRKRRILWGSWPAFCSKTKPIRQSSSRRLTEPPSGWLSPTRPRRTSSRCSSGCSPSPAATRWLLSLPACSRSMLAGSSKRQL
ncbi:YhgE/Pip domain-containing protein [Gordoniibacillus kamchatkensis]|uniref:YhgE/Pip domain-containing protein n=1 Tax=Gordoniibacillus kamchatkensis TaxID=1590651 RepID=UPI000B287741|nr:YhgE/Pip domain-containing protein [Paenibacillus sp. VKM B-2647]